MKIPTKMDGSLITRDRPDMVFLKYPDPIIVLPGYPFSSHKTYPGHHAYTLPLFKKTTQNKTHGVKKVNLCLAEVGDSIRAE